MRRLLDEILGRADLSDIPDWTGVPATDAVRRLHDGAIVPKPWLFHEVLLNAAIRELADRVEKLEASQP